ncbi:MAG: molybdopterin oxidoreductase, partial [Planctomycetota bacterium]|nr:molybdopterin oxidoreductase [Planctomycetota bacterium]
MTAALPLLTPMEETEPKPARLRPRPLDRSAVSLEPPGGGDLVAALLADQSSLTAVERFSRFHGAGHRNLSRGNYASLLPASPPGPGQQYAFEVD